MARFRLKSVRQLDPRSCRPAYVPACTLQQISKTQSIRKQPQTPPEPCFSNSRTPSPLFLFNSGKARFDKETSWTRHSLWRCGLMIIMPAESGFICLADKDFIFVNKPAGLATSGTDDSEVSLHDIIKEYSFKRHNFRPAVLFRLDKVCTGPNYLMWAIYCASYQSVTGLVVFAKHKQAETFFQSFLPVHQPEEKDGPGIVKVNTKAQPASKSRPHGRLVRGDLAIVHGVPKKDSGTMKVWWSLTFWVLPSDPDWYSAKRAESLKQ